MRVPVPAVRRWRTAVVLPLLALCLVLPAGAAATGHGLYSEIVDVSCSAPKLCAGVTDRGEALISTGPAAPAPRWLVQDIRGIVNFVAMSCTATELCAALDSNGAVMTTTDPTAAAPEWSAAHPTADPAALRFVRDIACPSTSLCVVVGDTVPPGVFDPDARRASVAVSTDPASAAPTWRALELPSARALSVACASPTLCAATTADGHVLTSTDPGAASPAWRSTEVDAGHQLVDVACPSHELCIAVDDAGRAVTTTAPAADAPRWSAPTAVGAQQLSGVSCATASVCMTVDVTGRVAASTDPASAAPTWQAVPLAAHLESSPSRGPRVSCLRALCAVSGPAAIVATEHPAGPWTWGGVAAPTQPPFGRARIAKVRVARDGRLGLRVTCRGPRPSQGCALTAVLTRRPTGGRLGWISFWLDVGQTRTTTVALEATGRRALRRAGRLPATLRVFARAPGAQSVLVAERGVTFTRAPR